MGCVRVILYIYNVINSRFVRRGAPDELSLVLDSRSGPLSEVLNLFISPNASLRPQQ